MAKQTDPSVVLIKWYDFTNWLLDRVDSLHLPRGLADFDEPTAAVAEVAAEKDHCSIEEIGIGRQCAFQFQTTLCPWNFCSTRRSVPLVGVSWILRQPGSDHHWIRDDVRLGLGAHHPCVSIFRLSKRH